MNPILLVARREIRERLKAKSFRIATVISAAAIVAAIAIPASQRGNTPTYDVGVVVEFFPSGPVVTNPSGGGRVPFDYDKTTIEAIRSLGQSLGMQLRVSAVPNTEFGRAALKRGEYDLVVVSDAEILTKRAPEDGDSDEKTQLIAAVSNLLRLQRLGPEGAAALQTLQTPVHVRGVEAPVANERERVTAFFGVLLLFVFLQQYGTWVLMGVIEEKASRVVEVLLSAVRPRQLVAGKVLGIGAVALVQGLVVAVAALTTALLTGTNAFEGASRFAILWTLAWFVLGYGLYSWAYAAVGSLVSRQADAQNAAFPLSVPVLVGYISATTLLNGGDPSPFVRVLAFLPPTAPMVMPMLIGLGKVPMWQVATSMTLVLVSIAILMRIAGDVYSRAILHSGQRLRLRHVLRRDFKAA